MITVSLSDSEKQITDKINAAVVEYVNSQIRKRSRIVLGRFKRVVEGWVRSQPEINSLLSEGVLGSLNAQFGLRSGQGESAADAIVNSVVDSTEIDLKKLTPKLRGGIEFRFQPTTFANLLMLPQGHTLSANGIDLHWLDWLLTKGDKVIVIGYSYKPSSKGRSRGGTMEAGGSFRVSPAFSGNRTNNFITRAFSNREKEIANLMSGLFDG